MLKAMCAVLPAQVPMLAVGGVDAGNAATWWAAGAKGFGVGSTLWGPAMPNPNPSPSPNPNPNPNPVPDPDPYPYPYPYPYP